MSLIKEIDYGTPIRLSEKTVTLTIDGQSVTVAGRHLGDGGGDEPGHQDPEALRHRLARTLRLLPALPRRDRGAARHARLLHHAGGRRHDRPHPVGEPAPACARA